MDGPRAARLNELPDVVELVNEVFMTGLGRPPVLGEFFPLLFSETNVENLRVISENGKPVSHVGIWEGDLLLYGSCLKVGMIGCVCTHPRYRGRGYASSLLRDAFSKMKEDGVDLVLVTGFRSLYRRLGCVEAGKVHFYTIRSGRLCLNGDGLKIFPYAEGDIYDLIGLYQREPLRYRRKIEEFRLLVERDLRCPDILLRTLIASEGSNPVAYISVGLVPDESEVQVFEYAGSRRAVLYLVENIFGFMKIESVQLVVPFHDWELLWYLDRNGFEKPPSRAQVTMTVTNPVTFVEKVGPLLRDRIGGCRVPTVVSSGLGRLKMAFEGKEKEFSPESLTLLFFGVPETLRSHSPRSVDPERFEGLSKALPLPTPIFGLNYK